MMIRPHIDAPQDARDARRLAVVAHLFGSVGMVAPLMIFAVHPRADRQLGLLLLSSSVLLGLFVLFLGRRSSRLAPSDDAYSATLFGSVLLVMGVLAALGVIASFM